MHIIIDTTPLKTAHKTRGIGRYTRNLFQALEQLDTPHTFSLTSHLDIVKADLIHYPYFDLFFRTLPLSQPNKTVVTIHDVIPLIFKKSYKPGLRGKLNLALQRQALKHSNGVITVSQSSARDINQYLNYPEEKIHSITLAADQGFKPVKNDRILPVRKKYSLPKNYWLYVGDVNSNKNVPGLLNTLSKFPQIHMVLVSRALQKKDKQAEEIYHLIETLNLKDHLTVLTNVPIEPKDDLRAIYSGADWYIQPSLYEGFGLPVLEAMACNTPVVTSDGGGLKETAGRAAILFEAGSQTGMETAITKALKMDAIQRNNLIAQGKKHEQQFSWEKTARETLKVYESLMSN